LLNIAKGKNVLEIYSKQKRKFPDFTPDMSRYLMRSVKNLNKEATMNYRTYQKKIMFILKRIMVALGFLFLARPV